MAVFISVIWRIYSPTILCFLLFSWIWFFLVTFCTPCVSRQGQWTSAYVAVNRNQLGNPVPRDYKTSWNIFMCVCKVTDCEWSKRVVSLTVRRLIGFPKSNYKIYRIFLPSVCNRRPPFFYPFFLGGGEILPSLMMVEIDSQYM